MAREKTIRSLSEILTRHILPRCVYPLNFLWTLRTSCYLWQRKPLLTKYWVCLWSNTRRSLTKGRAKIRCCGLLSCDSPKATLKCQLIESGNYPTSHHKVFHSRICVAFKLIAIDLLFFSQFFSALLSNYPAISPWDKTHSTIFIDHGLMSDLAFLFGETVIGPSIWRSVSQSYVIFTVYLVS